MLFESSKIYKNYVIGVPVFCSLRKLFKIELNNGIQTLYEKNTIKYTDYNSYINYNAIINSEDLLSEGMEMLSEKSNRFRIEFEIIDGNNDEIINILDLIYFVNVIIN